MKAEAPQVIDQLYASKTDAFEAGKLVGRAMISGPGEIALTLDHNEAQAILNGLREGGALSGPLVFDHVLRLKNKVESAMRAAGFPPIGS